MNRCPSCGTEYPDRFRFCPADGSPIEGEAAPRPAVKGAQISVRTLMLSIGSLILIGCLTFAAAFFYLYLKPKYGGLVIKTTPVDAIVYLDGKQQGATPLTLESLRAGGHQLRIVKEGYRDLVQNLQVMAYATENLHFRLEPLIPILTNEQLAEVEMWKKKLATALAENILLPPPEDFNVLFLADRILTIDPANAYASDARRKLAETLQQKADAAYASENWLEAEKQYNNLALLYPNDLTIGERLSDIAAKIDESDKDRETQVGEWAAKAEAAMQAGVLLPPEKDNALDAIRSIQRLDRRNAYARTAMLQLREMIQNRGDKKINGGDLAGARTDFRLALQYFPDDSYSKSRLELIESRLAEAARAEQQRADRSTEEQQIRQRIDELRQSAVSAYRSGAFAKSIADWTEFLKLEPNNAEAYFYVGAGYLEQKQFDSAILNFERSLSIHSGNALAHLNLGILYDSHRGNLSKAIEHLKKAQDMGGVERYTPDRLQSMIQDLQDRMQLSILEKTPFAAEHRHAFSSCRGNLYFTDKGIEFRTTETDHSFYESYAGLRNFSVTGEEIAIRMANNKKYNFRLLNRGDGERVRRLVVRHMKVQ